LGGLLQDVVGLFVGEGADDREAEQSFGVGLGLAGQLGDLGRSGADQGHG